jgi:glycosyltransferase involved in cell wall biosynthesis
MTSVLFISYYFPPTGGAPAQRSLKFVRYLPEEGYLPIVITGPGTSHNEWTPHDESLLKEIPPAVPIYRVPTAVPEQASRVRRRVRRWLGLPSSFSSWWISSAISLGERALKNTKPRIIYASMSPFESAEVAAYLSRKYGIPWVADLRDPWAIDEIQVYPSVLHKKLARARMHRLLSSAAVIVMNTPEATASLLRTFPDFVQKRVTTITNGFDPDDFSGLSTSSNGKFTIVHAGSFLTDLGLLNRRRRRLYEGLGGAIPGVDVATRSHLVLFEAIHRWCMIDPGVKEHLQIVFAGNPAHSGKVSLLEKSVLELTRFEGYLPREQSLGVVKSADLLFLPMHNLPGGHRSTTVPSKIYEYMASGRPILAAVPDGDARDFLGKIGTALICRPDDCDGIMEALRKAYGYWNSKHQCPSVNQNFLQTFERRRLTSDLAREFGAVLDLPDGRPKGDHHSRQNAA